VTIDNRAIAQPSASVRPSSPPPSMSMGSIAMTSPASRMRSSSARGPRSAASVAAEAGISLHTLRTIERGADGPAFSVSVSVWSRR
jgi:hypothetical protein